MAWWVYGALVGAVTVFVLAALYGLLIMSEQDEREDEASWEAWRASRQQRRGDVWDDDDAA